MDYLEFKFAGNSPSGKTQKWTVVNALNGTQLGEVSWFGAWRKYAFQARPTCYFDPGCMRTIADFCEKETANHGN